MSLETIAQASEALRKREVSCVELTRRAIVAIEEKNPALNAFITVTAEVALAQARERDDEFARGVDRGPLHGIPIGHKDLMLTKGIRTTSGSKVFYDYVPDHDAVVVRKLADAGAVSLGKLNLHELAYGVTSANPHFGPVRNPWHTNCIPGGSSGGSGVAVASGMLFMATGTDTGGSIRIPAAYCGTVGLKPTYGLVDRNGVRPLGFSLDHVGPLTRTVRDCAIAMQAIASMRPLKPGALDQVRVGLPENFYFEKIDSEVAAAVTAIASKCEAVGAHVIPVRVPDIDALNVIGRAILLAEASAAMENHLSRRDLFGPDVLTLLDQGRLLPATEYVNAQRLRRQFVIEFERLFAGIDILLTPTLPIVAPPIGQATVELAGETVDTRLATTRFVRGINVLGLPALSIPCGRSNSGLPIGAQLIGRAFEDAFIMAFAERLE